jgi:hypothetical protein
VKGYVMRVSSYIHTDTSEVEFRFKKEEVYHLQEFMHEALKCVDVSDEPEAEKFLEEFNDKLWEARKKLA